MPSKLWVERSSRSGITLIRCNASVNQGLCYFKGISCATIVTTENKFDFGLNLV